MKTRLYLFVMLALTIGCSRDNLGPTPASEPQSLEEAIVRANCLTVQAAAEEYAWSDVPFCSYFPMVTTSISCSGQSLITLLPGGGMLENPFTHCLSEPVDAIAECWGRTGYVCTVDPLGVSTGYVITGAGAESDLIVRLTDIDSPEGVVRRSCRRLVEALRLFYWENNGEYCTSIESDTSMAGHSVLYFLGGDPPENPYTGEPTHIVTGRPFYPGEIGYETISDSDGVYGYELTGIGESAGRVVIRFRDTRSSEEQEVAGLCAFLKHEVEFHADFNGGKYPRDLGTLLDMIRGQLTNPFTHSPTEPRMGRAVNPGEIGYEPLNGGWGYLIAGVGKKGDVISTYSRTVSPADTTVYFNCLIVSKAMEEFMSLNGGSPPKDLDQDTTLTGRTLIDLLPRGRRLANPVTGRRTEPHDRTAAYPGETGCSFAPGYYSINGVGEKGAFIYGADKFVHPIASPASTSRPPARSFPRAGPRASSGT